MYTTFTGKRTERLRIPVQVSLDPEMSNAIKARAVRGLRPIGTEIVRLLMVGLSHDPELSVYEQFLINVEIMARPHTVTHTRERRTA